MLENKFCFDAKKEFDYEAYYILWNDPEQQIAMMFRYVLLKDPLPNNSGAAVWGCFWDRNIPDNNVGFIKKYPLQELEILENGSHLKVANSGVFRDRAWGDISTNNENLSWEITIDDNSLVAIDRFPDTAQYQFFPSFSSPACKCKLNGWVKVNGKKYCLENVNGSDGHYSNIQNLTSWNWGNCVNFKEDKDFLFEGISARFNDWTTPSVWAFFVWNGEKYSCNIVDSMFHNKETQSELNSWEFIAIKNGYKFECRLSAEPEDMILLVHPLPDGSSLYTTISTTASMTISIYEEYNNSWNKVQTLTAEKTATFEVTKPIRNSSVIREFKII